ncbi:MAG: hypothetical protein REI09_12060 [Candidatus Dactylopiibacterium sp.]|nr:hypothetical protein [Candidatus Dactylopiibacterium sp.]
MTSSPPHPAEPTRAILEWLAAPPAPDLDTETADLDARIDLLHATSIASQQFQRSLEGLATRAQQLAFAHRHHMRHTDEPFAAPLRQRARAIAQALLRLALGMERTLTDADARLGLPQKRFSEAQPARALRLLGEALVVLEQAGFDPEPELWRLAARLYTLARAGYPLDPAPNPAETVLAAYKALLAIPTVAPHELTPAELDWTVSYLARSHTLLQVQEAPPPADDGAWYWLDPANTAEPHASARREAPTGRALLHFCTAGLARHAQECLQNPADPLLVPGNDYPGVQPLALLERLQARWSVPPLRDQPRRRQDYPVQACMGLDAIWETLRHGPDSEHVSEWTVLNESPGGYAIMNVQGRAAGLQAGMPVALRRHDEAAWTLCVVRWIRSDAINLIEIGLQRLSRGALPVRVGFRGADDGQPGMVPALVLPVQPAQRQHQAVMAPAGTYVSRRFALLSDQEHIYVAQCRLLSLDLQTASVELFQFEIDPYPL